MTYPIDLETFANQVPGTPAQSAIFNAVARVVEELQGKVGADGSNDPASLDYIVNRRITVYHLEKYGTLTTGAGFGAAIDEAFAAISASGVPGILYLPPGQHTDSVGGHIQPENVALMALGNGACVITHTANNVWMTALGDENGLLTVRWSWAGFTLTGNSGASAKGFVVGNTYRNQFRDVWVQGYTGGTGIEIRNGAPGGEARWTEGVLLDNVHTRNCAVNWALVLDGGSTSFAELHAVSCSIAITGSQVGIDIPNTAIIYGGRLDCKFNAENVTTNAVLLRVGEDAQLRGMTFEIEGETDGDPIGLQMGDGSFMHGPGRLDLWKPSSVRMREVLEGTAHYAIGSGTGSWGLVDTHLGEATAALKTFRTVISADGEVALVWHPNRLNCRVTMEFVGTDRRDSVTYEILTEQFDYNNPVITQIGGRYAFGGQKVFGHPGLRVIDGVGDKPTFVVTIGNRNGAPGILTVVVEAKGGSVWPSDLHVLEGNPGTMTGTIFYGTGWANEGVATIADGGVIAHGLPVVPTVVTLTPSVADTNATPSAIDGTNITVALKTAGAAGASQVVSWRASKP